MTRLLAVVAAFATSTLLLSATASEAAPRAPHYSATPAKPSTRGSIVAGNTIWTLRDGAYVAAKAGDTDVVACQRAARRLGALSAFSAAGTAFDEATLARCNSVAR